MRLIDADKLPYEDIECVDGKTYMVVNAYNIDNAPTISVQPKVVPIAEVRFDDDNLHEIVDEAVKNIEIKLEWIPIKWHNITEDEREREGYPKEWLTILDCQMPNDDEEVLVTVKGRNGNLYVETDTCYFDGTCYSSDNGYDWIDDVVAWMPLPKPYKESEDK